MYSRPSIATLSCNSPVVLPAGGVNPFMTDEENNRQLLQDFDCCICMETALPYVQLSPCNHFLCGQCAVKVMKCPLCKAIINEKSSIEDKTNHILQLMALAGMQAPAVVPFNAPSAPMVRVSEAHRQRSRRGNGRAPLATVREIVRVGRTVVELGKAVGHVARGLGTAHEAARGAAQTLHELIVKLAIVCAVTVVVVVAVICGIVYFGMHYGNAALSVIAWPFWALTLIMEKSNDAVGTVVTDVALISTALWLCVQRRQCCAAVGIIGLWGGKRLGLY